MGKILMQKHTLGKQPACCNSGVDVRGVKDKYVGGVIAKLEETFNPSARMFRQRLDKICVTENKVKGELLSVVIGQCTAILLPSGD
jgi:hypothetical protein